MNLENSNNINDINTSLKSAKNLNEANTNKNNELKNSITKNNENNVLASSSNIYISPHGTGTGSNESDPTNWNNAYYNIVDGGTITFTSGTYHIINQTISKNLTLQADINANVILDAQHKGFILKLGKGNLNIIGLTLANGTGYEYQSSLYGYPMCGGAIFIDHGTLNNINSTYMNNTATWGGGAICIFNYGSLNNTNTKFINNHANYIGGTILILNYGNITNNNTIIKNSSAGTYGGSILLGRGNINNINSTFISNTGTYGGAIKLDEGNITNINTNFNNNKAIDTIDYDDNYYGCGGSIYIGKGNIKNINTTYEKNIAYEVGGAISIENGTIINTDTNYITNTATNGGAISIENGTIINNEVNFKNNNANQTAGVIYTENCNITNTNTNYINNRANWTGGAINIETINEMGDSISNIINLNTTFINNTATESSGGAINIGFGSKSHIKNINTNYTNNTAGYYGMSHGGTGAETPGNGGAIYIDENSTIINTNCLYINNTAYGTYGGGAIYNWGSGNVINTNTSYINNKADANGGAINIGHTVININSTFINNTAGNNGIIIYDEEELYPTPETYITYGGAITSGDRTNINSTFINNTAGYGGAISLGEDLQEEYLPLNEHTLNNYKTIFINNTALKNNGGAIYINSGNINNAFTLFNNNIAKNGSGSAIYLFYGNIINTNSTYINNKAHDGQTINIKTGNLTNTNTTFNNNTQIKIGVYGENLTMTYGTHQNYTGKLYGNDGKPIIGQHVALKLSNSDGQSKTYYATTDTNGEYQLEINLYPGAYTAIASYDKYSCTNYIKVLKLSNLTSTILTANRFQEPYGTEANFTGKLTDNTGKALIGQHIALKLSNSQGQSKTYYATTDVNGEYQLAINLYPGQYYAHCTYSGTSVYESSTAEAAIIVTS